jgi:penicillin-binding protein 1A
MPYGLVSIADDAGQTLYRRVGQALGRAVAAPVAATLTGMLEGVVVEGTGRAARLDRPAAGKTGTSQESRDAWFVGFTADYVAGVWLGNDDGQPMREVTGGNLPARLWREVMLAAHAGRPARPLLPYQQREPESVLQRLFGAPPIAVPAPTPAGDFRYLDEKERP